nr:FxDxF family PEP-CTERM protein [Albitalea terrae]
MKIAKLMAAAAVALAAVSGAQADTLRFTATSDSAGTLGTLDADASVFDSSNSFQFVFNTSLIGLDFTDPLTHLHVTTLGPGSEGTIFDSTGTLPTVVGGFGFTGGTDFSNGVWIYGDFGVQVGGTDYSDVHWSTTKVSAVPEPESYAMILAGLGVMGFIARRRRAD